MGAESINGSIIGLVDLFIYRGDISQLITCHDKATIDKMVNSHRTSVPMKDPFDNSLVRVGRNFLDSVFVPLEVIYSLANVS
ncbi:Hypothetical protein POVR1_LOCUS326 [uncultured virus]|nr:Hypothetical protein POVR1_LOCUS326 [uncultured virus]